MSPRFHSFMYVCSIPCSFVHGPRDICAVGHLPTCSSSSPAHRIPQAMTTSALSIRSRSVFLADMTWSMCFRVRVLRGPAVLEKESDSAQSTIALSLYLIFPNYISAAMRAAFLHPTLARLRRPASHLFPRTACALHLGVFTSDASEHLAYIAGACRP